MKKETLAEFLARGGEIKKVTKIENAYVDKFEISKPNINTNKEAYFKFIKKRNELKNDNSGTN